MKRPVLVALAAVALVSLAVLLLRGHGKGPARPSQNLLLARAFMSDSLGVSLRLPESTGWSLRRDPPDSSGSVVTARHEGGLATVRLFVTSATDPDLDLALRRRQGQVAAVFGVKDLNAIITKVIRNERGVVGGHPTLQWQAMTDVGEAPGEAPSYVMFMWEIVVLKTRTVECLGVVRCEAQPKDERRAVIEGLLQDVAFILQSAQFR